MSSLPKLVAIFATLLLFCMATRKVDAEEFVICNGASYSAGSGMASSVTIVVNDLVQNTNRYYTYYTESPSSSSKVYGLATCNTGINPGDCTGCLVAARGVMLDKCRLKIGAQVRLDQNCFIRYEKYRFSSHREEAIELVTS